MQVGKVGRVGAVENSKKLYGNLPRRLLLCNPTARTAAALIRFREEKLPVDSPSRTLGSSAAAMCGAMRCCAVRCRAVL